MGLSKKLSIKLHNQKKKKCNINIVFLHTIFEKYTKMTRSFAKLHHHPQNSDQNLKKVKSKLQNSSYQQNDNCYSENHKTTKLQNSEKPCLPSILLTPKWLK